jgi:nicotinamide riboside kinase
VDALARGQLALEAEHAARGCSLLILDTDLLSTVVYSSHYYGMCPPWIVEELSQRAGDLYLLAGIDVPWVADGTQRDRGHRREEMQELFADALAQRSLRAVEVNGSVAERLRAAIAAVGAARSTCRSSS